MWTEPIRWTHVDTRRPWTNVAICSADANKTLACRYLKIDIKLFEFLLSKFNNDNFDSGTSDYRMCHQIKEKFTDYNNIA